MIRLTRIDESNIGDHVRLNANDECYFLYEYTSGKNYSYSKTNQLISNLKKSPNCPAAQRRYKIQAINQCAAALRLGLNAGWLQGAVLVPIPGSKAIDHAEFDNRMTLVCQRIGATHDTIELVTQQTSTDAAHVAGGHRVDVNELLAIYEINPPDPSFSPTKIAIVDDVLTAGTHYRAMHTILSQHYPTAQIIGVFIARRVFPPDQIGLGFI